MNTIWKIGICCLVVYGVLSTGCTDRDAEIKARNQGRELWFEEVVHDYGEIPQHSDGAWSFAFKNLGEEAVVINRVRSTCGCTVPSWPKEPIKPGSSGMITVIYDTDQVGTFTKSAYVYSTAANSPVKLQIKGKVLPQETEP